MFASNVIHISRRGLGVLMTLSLLLMPLLSTANGNVCAAPAYTEVGGPIISDTTWTLANSPYIVVANVEVWQSVTLTIQPGVVVKFNKDKLLQVNGTLIARGTAVNPIVFTSNQASPAKGDWKNINFTDSSVDATLDGAGNYTGGSILEYCIVKYGGNTGVGAIQTDRASPLIDHCMVRNSASSGIWAVGASTPMVIRNNTVSGNSASSSSGGGIHAAGSTVISNTVSGNSANDFGGGIYTAGSTVTGNTVSGNSAGYSGGGIYAEYSTVISNTVSDNSAGSGGGIFAGRNTVVTDNTVSGNSAFDTGGGIYAEYSTVISNTISRNSATGDYARNSYGGGIFARYRSTVTGNTVSDNLAGYGGGIYAVPGYGSGIYAVYDSPVTANTVSGNSASIFGGGIYAEGTVISNTVSGNSASQNGGGIYATGTVKGNTVLANRLSTATGQGSGAYFKGSGDFAYNTIVGSTAVSPTAIIGGVAIESSPQFHHNNLYGNSNYDVVVLLSSSGISGTNNYWGTAATVDILAHVYDWYDDSTRGKLLYIPYLQDPDPGAPVPPPQNLRAAFAGGSASLSWDAIPSMTTGYGYKVYYDTDASGPPYNGAGANQGNSPIDVGNATHFTLSGLGSGVYVAVTAYDTQGRESWYSNEGSSPRRIYLPAVLRR